MNEAATYSKRLTARMGALTLAAFLVLAVLCPLILRLGDQTAAVVGRVMLAGVVTTIAVATATSRTVARYRFTLRTLALGSQAIEANDLEALGKMGSRVVWLQVLLSVVANLLLGSSWLRPPGLPAGVAHELSLLGIAAALAVVVPARVMGLRLTGELLEVAPHDAVAELVAELARRGHAHQLGRRTLALAVVLPVLLVGVGGVLASLAHLRAMTEESRTFTALTLARGVVGPGELKQNPSRLAALAVARQRGYEISLTPDTLDRSVKRGDRHITHTAVLDHGSAVITFSSDIPFSVSAPLPALALLLLLGAWAGAHLLSGLVSRDLTASALRLATLGTERVIRGGSAEHFVARFGVVAALENAALALAERFRVFANAQEKALAAKEAALRARGLFFASISHDLKTPLNAIIGFADAIDESTLSAAQRESLGLISTRGRELVLLIETILDAARVEAGQLQLARVRTSVSDLIAVSASSARQLAGQDARLRILPSETPDVPADKTHLPRALGVILANAMRSRTLAGEAAQISLSTHFEPESLSVRLVIHYGDADVSPAELESLFARQARARARGLVLGLGLSRSVIELHGGRIEFTVDDSERLRLCVVLPTWQRGRSPTLPPPP